jgi:hypothetical protein
MRNQRKKKGQAVFEFVLAALILFSIVIYVITYLSNSFNLHHNAFESNRLEGNAMRIADYLLSDRVGGIAYEWPLLSKSLMASLNSTCNDTAGEGYFDVLERMNLIEEEPYVYYTHMKIMAVGKDGKIYIDCGRTPSEKAKNAVVTRYGVVEDQITKINITVW